MVSPDDIFQCAIFIEAMAFSTHLKSNKIKVNLMFISETTSTI